MVEHADDVQLKQAFQSHLQASEVHVSRLKQLIGDVNDDARQHFLRHKHLKHCTLSTARLRVPKNFADYVSREKVCF
jgi:hypothetical protein